MRTTWIQGILMQATGSERISRTIPDTPSQILLFRRVLDFSPVGLSAVRAAASARTLFGPEVRAVSRQRILCHGSEAYVKAR
jgi:hypothetical protein